MEKDFLNTKECKEEKRDNWFLNYQEIPELKIKGLRSNNDRLSFFDKNDFKDKSVIDIGCNMGQMSFQAEKWGANKVFGIEYDITAHKNSLELKKKLNSKVKFILDDIDNPFFWNTIEKFDISLFLSVIDTKEITNRYGNLSKICNKTKEIMYFEGHIKQHFSKYIDVIMKFTDFSQIEYLGQQNDTRVFIKCSRQILNSNNCIQKIIEESKKFNKIAIIGKSYAGKSFIRNKLEKENLQHVIIDDLRKNNNEEISKEDIKKVEKLILFDYRALQYVDDFDVVFFVHVSEELLQNPGYFEDQMRSPFGSYKNIKKIFTVKSR